MNATEQVRPQEIEISEDEKTIIRARLTTLEQDKKSARTAADVFRRFLHPSA